MNKMTFSEFLRFSYIFAQNIILRIATMVLLGLCWKSIVNINQTYTKCSQKIKCFVSTKRIDVTHFNFKHTKIIKCNLLL